MTSALRIVLSGCVALLAATPASAHHSFGMFDLARRLTLAGTVKEFQFGNPHCFIQLMVLGQDGTPAEWSIEMGSPSHLIRHGWKVDTIKPGDKISVVINPVRDGGKGGSYVSATGADGKAVGAEP